MNNEELIKKTKEVLNDYEAAKACLYFRLGGDLETNELTAAIPHTQIEDMSVTYHLLMDESSEETKSLLVTGAMVENWGVSVARLHQDAAENTEMQHRPKIQTLSSMLGMEPASDRDGYGNKLQFEDMLEKLDFKNSEMYVLTNFEGEGGATVMCYPGVLESIAEHAEKDFFVIPSSVHEMLILPDDGYFNLRDLKMIVKDVNESVVAPDERLSDSVYHYDCADRIFEKAERFEERMAEKTMEKGPEKRLSIKEQLASAKEECEKQTVTRKPQERALY